MLAALVGPLAEGESNELIVDNADAGAAVEGVWSESSFSPGFVGEGYLFTRPQSLFNPVSRSSAVSFSPDLVEDGKYAVFGRWTSHSNRATNVPITVNHRDGVFETDVNQRTSGGVWVELGQFNLVLGAGHQLTVGADGVNGVVVADAARFVRIGDLDPPAEPSDEIIVDNDDTSGVAIEGNWLASTGIGGFFDSDYLYAPQPEVSTVTFTPNLGEDGQFEVFARWTSHANRASDTPITVNHSGGVFSTQVNQRVDGGEWISLGEFDLDTGVSNVVIGGARTNGLVVADAVRFVRTGDAVMSPEISVSRGQLNVPSGGIVEFGTTTVGSPVDVTLTVRNSGDALLELTPPAAASLPSGFELLSSPATAIQPGETTSLAIRLSATTSGTFLGTISIVSNDQDESPYVLTLSGTADLESVQEEVIVDNDDVSGVQIEGIWRSSTFSPGFFDGDYLVGLVPGTSKVTFTPELSGEGRYEVFTRWTSDPNRATNAPVTIVHRDGALTTAVNQREMGGEWVSLGEFNLENNQSNVMVGTLNANGVVVADAVRFVRVGDATLEPEVTVLRDGDVLQQGSTLDFGQSTVGTSVDIDLTVRNDGTAPLIAALSGAIPTGFAVLSTLPSSLLPGQSGTLTIRLAADVVGSFSGTVAIGTNDADENPFQIQLQGTVNDTISTAPEITVLDSDGNQIADGSTLDFEETLVGSPVTQTITIRNDGDEDLTLTLLSDSSLPRGFVGTSPAISTLGPGQSVVWSLQLTATETGSFSGPLSIANNDADENPFGITLQGIVEEPAAPEITILGNGVNRLDGGILDFGSTVVGSTIDVTLMIRNDGDADLSLVPLDPTGLPVGFSGAAPAVSNIIPGQSTIWVLRLDADMAGTFSGSLAIENGDADENPFDLTLQGTVTEVAAQAPEITLLRDDNDVSDGGLVDFGSTTVGIPVDVDLIVFNDGDADLILSPLDGGSLPTGFEIVTNVPGSIPPGEDAVLSLRLTAAEAGAFGGSIAIANNDSTENPFDLLLQGTVTQTQSEITLFVDGNPIDDGSTVDFGSTAIGSPVTRVLVIRNDGGADLALTPLSTADLPLGFVVTSGPAASNLAPGEATAVSIQLQATASGAFSGSVAIVNSDSDENPFDLTLQGSVAAPEITILLDGTEIADGGTIDFGDTSVGTPAERVIAIRNDGVAPLVLTEIVAASLPAGFELVSAPASLEVAVGQTVELTVRMAADEVSSPAGTLMIASNDSDENPYDLLLQGSVRLPLPDITLLIGGSIIVDGGTVDFGLTSLGSPVDIVLTIRNDGEHSLSLPAIDPGSAPAGFAITLTPAATSLLPGQEASLRVQLLATTSGQHVGSIAIVSDDPDENPYDLNLVGVVADGQYAGTVTGTADIPGIGMPPVNLPLEFQLAGDTITVLEPTAGTGTVVGDAITFGTVDANLGTCTFTGDFSADRSSAAGAWTCPALSIGGSASGTWQATVIAEGEGEGEGNRNDSEEQAAWEAAVDQLFGQE